MISVMKKIPILLLVLAGLGLGWFLLKHRNVAAAEEESAKPAAKVETTALIEQAIARTVEVFGIVAAAPSGDRVISLPYDCVVRKIHTAVGTAVAAGDLLLEVEPSPDAKLAADSARSVQALAKKSLAAMQERYELKLATSQDLLAAQQAAEDANLKAESLAARGLSGDGRITTAAAGVVSKLEVLGGAFAPAGTVLVSVSTGGQLEVRLGVEATDAGAVAAGQAVALESSNRPEAEKIATTVRLVGAVLDPSTGAAEVRAAVPAGAPLLLGEHVRAQIEVQRKDHALVVPRSAVLPDEDKRILFTVKHGKAVRHEVQLGLATDELQEVTGDGLQPGDLVVTLGNYELEDGMAIQAPERKQAAAGKAVKPTPEAKP
jgi:membrane fusion protein (multidrug efflux system)